MQQRSQPAISKPSQQLPAANVNTIQGTGRVLLRILPVQVCTSKRAVKTYALIGRGSTVSLIENSLAEKLGVQGKRKQFAIKTVNGISKINSKEVSLVIKPIDGSTAVNICNAWAVPALSISPDSIPRRSDADRWQHLKDISVPEIEEKQISLLIGSDTPEVFCPLETRSGSRGEPLATRTILGWTIQGPATGRRTAAASVNRIEGSMVDHLKAMWEHDFKDKSSTSKAMSQEDKKALKMLQDSKCLEEGRYKFGLPWKEGATLPHNRSMAEHRLRLLHKKFRSDTAYAEKYTSQLEDYISKGYASTANDAHTTEGKVWYIPHHGVTNPKKPGKLRVVFDAAARFRGISLNDALMQGPDLVNSLVGVLMRFRQHPVAIISDIEAMFHQVAVQDADRGALRFLWTRNGNPDSKVEEFQMNRFIFGAKPSPSAAALALASVASDFDEVYSPEVISTIKRNFYVDDMLKSVPTIADAIELSLRLRELLKKRGFNLTKWSSNQVSVLNSIPEPERAPDVREMYIGDSLPVGTALGLLWSKHEDCFVFKVNSDLNCKTRRQLLSKVASLFDPLGFVAPITLFAKCLLQRLCNLNLGWDAEIPEEEATNWKTWTEDLTNLETLRVPRCISPPCPATRIELHAFSDASTSGYGACCYLLFRTDRESMASLIHGKSRVTPSKVVTVPRLELTAAVLACTMATSVKEEIEFNIDRTVFWTDSTIVLAYIRNKTKRFKVFVANRIEAIHEHSEPDQWRHVPTKLNPADIASRGMNASDTTSITRWLKGPDFLVQDEDSWPAAPDAHPIFEGDEEIKKEAQVNAVAMGDSFDSFLAYFSSFFLLLRALAYMARFKVYFRHKIQHTEPPQTGLLQSSEINSVRMALIAYIQAKAFESEIKALKTKGFIPASSRLFKLCPFIKDGILRVGGRLKHAPTPLDAKHQVILPASHHVTKLVARHYHVLLGHTGPRHLLSKLRQKYWVVNGLKLSKEICRDCMKCKKLRARPLTQLMADLPPERMHPNAPPFTNTGIDFFGPFFVTVKRSRVKRYGCLFNCLTTRAVHLEVCHNMDTQSFLCAFSRFIARRGRPHTIFSDNGTNLTRASKELKEEIKAFNKNQINTKMIQHGITWKFQPPHASHMNGVTERLIRTVRGVLSGLLKPAPLKDETLLTLFTEVEYIVNSRPLTATSEDIEDESALTANHLLLLRPTSNHSPRTGTGSSCLLKRWREAHYLANAFWKRWSRDYLSSLQMREKWQRPHASVKEGDLVLLVEEHTPRGQWPLARVVQAITGRDGRVRACRVKSRGRELTRPIVKMCLLEQSE